jgi:hypothetical protein
MLTKLARFFVILTTLAAGGLITTFALAGEVKDSGSFDASYTKRDTRPIPDQQGHMLLLTESSGKSTNPGGLIDGFPTTVVELADLRRGNGPHQGYVIYQKGSDQEVVRFEGQVTTTMKDGRPDTKMKGKYEIVAGTGALSGIQGEGAYTGYFTAEDKYHIDWQGSRAPSKDAMATSQ